MITLIDLKQAVINKLEAKYPTIPIVGQGVAEGFNKPAFFVSLLPVETRLMNQKLYTEKALVVINYFGKDKTKEEKDALSLQNLKIGNDIKFCFFPNFQIKDRSITVSNIETNETDGFLTVQFSARYIEEFKQVDNTELMKELHIKNEVK